MNNSEVRQSEIKGLLRGQKELGGVVPSKLKSGTRIFVECNEFMYGFTAMDTPSGRLYSLSTGSTLCRNSGSVIHIQSHSTRLKYDIPDWIGKGMKLILKNIDGSSTMIGQVQGVTVSGKTTDGKGYSYDLWKKPDLS